MERIRIFGTANRRIPDKMLSAKYFDDSKYDCKYDLMLYRFTAAIINNNIEIIVDVKFKS